MALNRPSCICDNFYLAFLYLLMYVNVTFASHYLLLSNVFKIKQTFSAVKSNGVNRGTSNK